MFLTIACGDASTVDPLVAASLDNGYYSQDNVEHEDYFRVRWTEIEEMIVGCMGEAGFDYLPSQNIYYAFGARPVTSMLSPPRVNDDGVYGIVAGILATSALDRDEDPNNEYLNSLSNGEAEQYFKTLNGGRTGPTDHPTEESCRGQAESEVWGRDRAVREATDATLADLAVRIQADPTFVGLASQWSKCMAAAGFEFSTQTDISPFVTQKIFAAPRPAAGLSGQAYADAWAQELDEVVALERSIATADQECLAPHQSEIDEVLGKHYEREFGDDWRSFVTLYVAP